MTPEIATEAMRTDAEETYLINQERHASGASDRTELADVGRMITVIEDGGYLRGILDRLRELEARQDELKERLSAAHPPISRTSTPASRTSTGAGWRGSPRRWTIRGGDAAAAIRSLIDRIVLTPGRKRGEMDAVLHGDFGTILEWAGGGNGNVGLGGCGGRI